jgi:hypothetical protein
MDRYAELIVGALIATAQASALKEVHRGWLAVVIPSMHAFISPMWIAFL